MRAQEPCRHEGCTRARTRHSVFCDEHHQEQLIRAGLRPAVLPVHDPRAQQVKRCRRLLRNHGLGLITRDELHAQLADLFVQSGMDGESEHWPHCFDALPPDVAAGLLAYVRAAGGPRVFSPTPGRVAAARVEHSRLIAALEARLGQSGGSAAPQT